jgi:vancomycin permeability regulator SanA
MKTKVIAATVLLAAFVTPALAAEFYIVQDTTSKKCTIVEKKPTVSTMVVVGDGKVYTTKAEAEGAMKTVKVCSSM